MGSIGTSTKSTSSSSYTGIRSDIEKAVTDKYTNYWKSSPELAGYTIRDAMDKVDEVLNYFRDKNMIESSDTYDDEIVWRFSGKDKESGKYAGFEFDSSPTQANAKSNLAGNGYSVSQGLLFPKPLFNYLMDHTNVTEKDIEVMRVISTAALKRYKKR